MGINFQNRKFLDFGQIRQKCQIHDKTKIFLLLKLN